MPLWHTDKLPYSISRIPATPEEPPCPDPRSTRPTKSAAKLVVRASASTTTATARPFPRGKRSAIGASGLPSRWDRRRPRPEREDPAPLSQGDEKVGAGE